MKNKILLMSLFLTVMASTGLAQDQAAKGEVSGFSFVLPAKDGGKQCIVRGDTANFLPDGKIEITNVKTQVFRKKSSDIFITSPKAKFDKSTREVVTKEDIEIATQEMVIEGTGLHWSPNDNKAEISKNVKVTIVTAPGDVDF